MRKKDYIIELKDREHNEGKTGIFDRDVVHLLLDMLPPMLLIKSEKISRYFYLCSRKKY
jgi:hypothetical protein